ncbi:MAG: PQQ-binding-like beta-propeller repeat protein [Deltaproteobacteria bacterium]|nr:PQQ-binding-like beta-propeller repeat protein [Deltaproteobacteria bacterium]
MSHRPESHAFVGRTDRLADEAPERPIALAHRSLPPLTRDRLPHATARPPLSAAEKKWWRIIGVLAAAVVVLALVAGWLVRQPLPSQPHPVVGWAERDTALAQVAPLLTAINGDGVDDFVGRFTGEEPRGQYVGAFDGASRSLLWRVGPLEPLAKPRQLAVSDQRLAIISGAELSIHRLADGSDAGRHDLPGPVVSSCANPSERGPIWVMLAEEGRLVDLRTGQHEPAARPRWCRPRAVRDAPAITGFAAELALTDGNLVVTFGRRDHDTGRDALLLGFERGESRTRWVRPIGGDDETAVTDLPRPGEQAAMRDGRLYVSYYHRQSNRSRLLAVDGTTGHTLWRAPVPDSAGHTVRAMIAGRHHLYVVHAQRLSVYDVVSGERLHTLGGKPQR